MQPLYLQLPSDLFLMTQIQTVHTPSTTFSGPLARKTIISQPLFRIRVYASLTFIWFTYRFSHGLFEHLFFRLNDLKELWIELHMNTKWKLNCSFNNDFVPSYHLKTCFGLFNASLKCITNPIMENNCFSNSLVVNFYVFLALNFAILAML